jgi:hypothetical protein
MAGEKENIASDYVTPWQQKNKLLTQNLLCGINQIFLKSYTVLKAQQCNAMVYIWGYIILWYSY